MVASTNRMSFNKNFNQKKFHFILKEDFIYFVRKDEELQELLQYLNYTEDM